MTREEQKHEARLAALPRLAISFSWDCGSNLFYAQLENGARFAVAPNLIGGKLGANLALFREACEAERKEEPFRPTLVRKSPEQEAIDAALAEGKLRRYSPSGKLDLTELSLEDLGL